MTRPRRDEEDAPRQRDKAVSVALLAFAVALLIVGLALAWGVGR